MKRFLELLLSALMLLSLLTACGDNVLDPRTRQHVRDALAAVMPTDRPGDFNQAMMDLLSLIHI